MSERTEYVEELKNAPDGSVDHNHWLCINYPWLIPHNKFTDTVSEDFDYSWTELDAMPDGWRKAFGEQMCEEIQQLLEPIGYEYKYKILQIKEKFGYLRWYSKGVPKEINEQYNAIIRKYEDLSARTCFICGEPATKISTGWICPWCDKCASEYEYDVFVPIDEWFKEQETPFADGGTFRLVSIEPFR